MRSQVASTGNHPTFEPLTYDAVPRVRRVQSQVDEVIDVMQENISKVIERGERLDDLQDKSGESFVIDIQAIIVHSSVFEPGGAALSHLQTSQEEQRPGLCSR